MTHQTDHSMPTAAPPSPGGSALAPFGKDPRLLMHPGELLNVETPVTLLNAEITPIERMFLRNNHTLPLVDPADWQLTIDGLVRHPLTLTLADLHQYPAETLTAVLECSGNGREQFAANGYPTEGVQWRNGAVANARWTGVPLRTLLTAAGVSQRALQAECWGAGAEAFARGIEITKLHADALLAYALNGAPLPHLHGGPVRLVVPGWGGINWVKWITHMRVIAHESTSIYNQQNYVLYDEVGLPFGKVRNLLVKSLITSLEAEARLASGWQRIEGVAWSGGDGIAQVDISFDAGHSWHPAALAADSGPAAWRRWAFDWQAPPGTHMLAVRATDQAGNVQPWIAQYNQKGYQMNAVQQVRVHVT
jgi:DMSO/TMAO reductase YedYZ molybdopterin-dependent catalytic subunit